MNVASPNIELINLIKPHDFLQLTTSQEAFPDSQGTGLPIIRVHTAKCDALIAIQGAHLLSFNTHDGNQLLWVSPNCNFTPGVALRGGIPVCLPWFGPNADPAKPKHGFARNRDWTFENANLLANGDAELMFNFSSGANELFDFDFAAQLVMTLGDKIKLEINVSNLDKKDFDCSWVLHSYHPVNSLNQVLVKGLAGRTYLDNLEKHAAKIQHGDVDFQGEVDRVFPAIENSLEIVGTPNIEITHHNCPSVVVWNPGATNAAKMADVGAGNEQGYICVERGAVLDEKWNLAAGENKSAWVEIIEK
ncbi:MAG: D-hexose-6-phosphate mutarotase [Gammaproteobacteria bacterium]|nr:MAG: D-hexose-6-phosphate mutarotase [Gammaproteobacteria bacterium]